MLVQIPEEIVSVLSFIIFFTTWLVTQCCRRPDEHSPVPFFRLSVNSLWVWEACFAADTRAMENLRVSAACFVADTHAMESLWVYEACFAADTHAMKNRKV